MAEPAFDTMAAVRRLRDSGLEERQAEAITETVREGITGGVATKADLSISNAGLRDDLTKMEAGLREDLTKMEAGLREDMTKMDAALRKDISRLEIAVTNLETEFRTQSRIEFRWIKIIGGAILAVLIFPWLAEFLSITMPGAAG